MSNVPAASLSRQTIWLILARTLAFGFALALPLFLTRHMSQAEFGLYKQVFLVLMTAVNILPLGFQMSAMYFLGREPERKGQFILNILLFHLAAGGIGALVLIAFPQQLGAVFRSAEIASLSPWMGAMVFFWVTSSFLETVALANQETGVSSFLIVGTQFSKVTILLTAAVWKGSVFSLVLAAIVQGILQTTLLLWYLRSRFPGFWRGFDGATLRRQLSYSLPFGFSGLLWNVQLDLHNYMVSHQFPPEVFAVYSIGCFQLPLIGILTDSVTSMLIPRVSAHALQAQKDIIVGLTLRAMRKLALVFFPAYCLLLSIAPHVLALLFSERYRQSWPIFVVNLTMLPLYTLVLDPIVRAYAGERHFLLRIYILLTLLQAVALWFFIKWFGPIGAITVVVLTNLASRLAVGKRVATILEVKPEHWKELAGFGRIAAAAAVGGLASWIVAHALGGSHPSRIVFLSGSLGAITYGVGLLLLGVLTSDEREMIRSQLNRFRERFWVAGVAR